MAGIIDDLKKNYKHGSALIKLIFINLGIFLVFQLISLFLMFTGNKDLLDFNSWFSVPSDYTNLLLKPWTILTYMFYHQDIWHIVFNLLWFYWFGKIFLHFFDQKKLVALYFAGGIAGAVLFILSFNFIHVYQEFLGIPMRGASASIMAIVFAISFYKPNFRIMLLFFGEVKIIYIALVSLILDLILLQSNNAGGHIAHIGGAFIGWLWSAQYRKGNDFTSWITWFFDFLRNIFKPKTRLKVSHKKPVSDLDYNRSKIQSQKEIDQILDKISKGGYDSLTKEEKAILFKMSDKK
jgi:membrane associated rhomboid family serine protease